MHNYVVDLLVLLSIGAVFWLRSLISYRRRNPRGLSHPPGPKGIPVLGNVLDMPKSPEWVGIAEWQKIYGDVTYVENFGQPMLFINGYEAAVDLLEKRSSIYSDRARAPMLGELMGLDWALPLMPYGDRFRKYRSLLHRFLHPTAVKEYHGVQIREAHYMVDQLLKSPDKYRYYLRRMAGAVIMKITYGHDVAPENDPFITLSDKATAASAVAAVPGAYLVDTLPSLKYVPSWMPGAKFKRQAAEWKKLSVAILNTPYEMTKERINNGLSYPSMMKRLLEFCTDKDGRVHDEDAIAACTAVTYGAGADTTVSSTLSAVLAFVMYPEVQRRGQEEVDRVVGKGRLPNFEDYDSLPYVQAIVAESLRWSTVLPFGTPHALTHDDVYRDWFIPAGTQVIANQWGMLRDENEYPNPEQFRPDRWLPKDGEKMPRHSNKIAFGFGRRICPGKHLAENSIFIGVAMILATLNFSKALDEQGQPITPTGAFNPGFISQPEPFDCLITPRSPEAADLIRQATENERHS